MSPVYTGTGGNRIYIIHYHPIVPGFHLPSQQFYHKIWNLNYNFKCGNGRREHAGKI
jgi:hypothetical protein